MVLLFCSCEVIRDHKTKESLQYAFIEFEKQEDCESAYFKMDNVLIDDRRIHVDFSQSVSKYKWKGKGRGVEIMDEQKDSFAANYRIKDNTRKDKKYDLVYEDEAVDNGPGEKKKKKKKHKERKDSGSEDESRKSSKHKKHKHKKSRSRSRERKRHRSRSPSPKVRSRRSRSRSQDRHTKDRYRSSDYDRER